MEVEQQPVQGTPGAPSEIQKERSPSPVSFARTRRHRPYFTPEEVAILSEKQRGGPTVSEGYEDRIRQQACGFMEAVGLRMGFPRKTIATAQMLYHRFRLFFPLKDFNFHDVSSATLYVSSKLHDTIKKPQEILGVGYGVRFPNLVNAVTGLAEVDPESAAEDRKKVIVIERLILETICFNFTVQMAFSYIIKFGKELGATKDLTKLAWRLAADSHRTLVGLQYPPHSVSLACIYLAALLTSFEATPIPVQEGYADSRAIVGKLSTIGVWEASYKVRADDLEEICYSLLDLLITYSGMAFAFQTSPTSPSSPSPYPSPRTPNPFRSTSGTSGSASHAPAAPRELQQIHMFTTAHLTRLKIAIRGQASKLRADGHAPRQRGVGGKVDKEAILSDMGLDKSATEADGVGRNEGTVRYLFGPDRE